METVLRDYAVTMISSRYWLEEDYWHVRRRQVSDSFFLIPVIGNVFVKLDDEEKVIGPGEFIMVPEGVYHELSLADGCRKLEQIVIHFHILNMWRMPGVNCFQQHFFPLPHPEYWFATFRQLICMHGQSAAAGQRYGEMLIKGMLMDMIAGGAKFAPPEVLSDLRVAKALQTIHEQYGEELSVAQLAAECQLSTVQFRKLFARQVGRSPKAYILYFRLRVAARMLRSTVATVQEVAFAVGFNGEPYFHRCFKEMYGCTPLHYRRGVGHWW